MRWRMLAFGFPSIALAGAMLSFDVFAQLGPTTRPTTNPIVEVALEDPLTSESRCYLDLDTGKIMARGESRADLVESRQWIHDNGVDFMCESRDPANGLIAYDMRLRPSTVDINQPPDFVTLRRMFDKAEATPFDFVTPGQTLPKTYLFKTSDDAMGVLEISGVVEKPSGMRLRYRLVTEPPLAPLVRNPNAARNQAMAMQVNVQQLRLNKLRETYGENHPEVQQAERMLALNIEMAKVTATETDPRLVSLKIDKLNQEYLLEQVKARVPDDSPMVKKIQRQVDILKIQIEDRQALLNKKPATKPAPVTPVTRPFADNLHL